jgi:hypothetical protein
MSLIGLGKENIQSGDIVTELKGFSHYDSFPLPLGIHDILMLPDNSYIFIVVP